MTSNNGRPNYTCFAILLKNFSNLTGIIYLFERNAGVLFDVSFDFLTGSWHDSPSQSTRFFSINFNILFNFYNVYIHLTSDQLSRKKISSDPEIQITLLNFVEYRQSPALETCRYIMHTWKTLTGIEFHI